jgi:hypothetical protein
VPEVTVVAKGFTLIQAAPAAGFNCCSFILLEPFSRMPQTRNSANVGAGVHTRPHSRFTLIGVSDGSPPQSFGFGYRSAIAAVNALESLESLAAEVTEVSFSAACQRRIHPRDEARRRAFPGSVNAILPQWDSVLTNHEKQVAKTLPQAEGFRLPARPSN